MGNGFILNSTKDKVVDAEYFHFNYIDLKTSSAKHHTVIAGDLC